MINKVVSDIDCANCFMSLGITEDFVNLAFCNDDCRNEYYRNMVEEAEDNAAS